MHGQQNIKKIMSGRPLNYRSPIWVTFGIT